MATTPLMQVLLGYLKVTADRQQIVASNIANVDTPGYHVKDINFQSAMQQVMLKGDDAQLGPATNDVEGLPERPDGNNVNIDRESLLMAQNQLQFQTEVSLLHSEFNRLQLAINGGSGQ